MTKQLRCVTNMTKAELSSCVALLESVHGTKCKDLDLGEWSNEQLKNGVNALKFIDDKK